jgi:hypothetical protein
MSCSIDGRIILKTEEIKYQRKIITAFSTAIIPVMVSVSLEIGEISEVMQKISQEILPIWNMMLSSKDDVAKWLQKIGITNGKQ